MEGDPLLAANDTGSSVTDAMGDSNRRAIIFDPFPLLLEGVERVLGRVGVDVVGKATTPDHALAILSERRPDVLVAELGLRNDMMHGGDFVREARRRSHDVKIVVFSERDDQHSVSTAFELGAVAYVVKTAHPDDLAAAVRQAFEHSIYLPGSRSVATAQQRSEPVEDLQGLTRREQEILRLVSEGHSNAELARMLWVTEQTVKFHLSNIYRKLGVANRTEAGRWAQLHGLLSQPPPRIHVAGETARPGVSLLRPARAAG